MDLDDAEPRRGRNGSDRHLHPPEEPAANQHSDLEVKAEHVGDLPKAPGSDPAVTIRHDHQIADQLGCAVLGVSPVSSAVRQAPKTRAALR